VSPAPNRVTPLGEIAAFGLRGAWTGNRGCVHRGREIVRGWASHHWLTCALEYQGIRREQWRPGRLTWLFFHDEAVAFAAGHRPCALCRRPAYQAFRAAWAGEGELPSHDALDRALHAERLEGRARRLHARRWPSLPDGTFVLLEDDACAVVRGDAVVPWTRVGYGAPRTRPGAGTAKVLTPPSVLAAFAAGYPVQVDAAA
jgi:hypothetical protein